MAGISLSLPPKGGDGYAAELGAYLFRLAEQLQYAFAHLEFENFSEQERAQLAMGGQAAAGVAKLEEEQAAAFQKLRGEIVKTAAEVQSEYATKLEQTEQFLRTEAAQQYVARTQGDPEGSVSELKEFVASAVLQTAREVRMEFSETAEIAQETADGLSEYRRAVAGYIRFDADGIEIGKTAEDESLPYSVKITNEKMSFLQNGAEVAYVMYNKLYITAVEVLDRLTVGSSAMGGYFDFETSENGMGVIWRDAF